MVSQGMTNEQMMGHPGFVMTGHKKAHESIMKLFNVTQSIMRQKMRARIHPSRKPNKDTSGNI